MRFHYKEFSIDATPDEQSGVYVAKVRITAQDAINGPPASQLVDRSDLGQFSREAFAVECAVNWAIAWIDAFAVDEG